MKRLLLAVLLVAGCAPLIGADPDLENVDLIKTEPDGAAFRTQVNATDEAKWVYAEMSAATEIDIEDPQTSTEWHLSFLRFNIASNGGISGPSSVGAIRLQQSFDSVTSAPASGYITDDFEQYAFEQDDGWFEYDALNHTLTPWPNTTYVVELDAGNYIKLEFLSYYDEFGTSAVLSFRWAPL